jgi:dynein heavy chain 1, cytosolic
VIDYRLVLNRINTKYDSWHAEILNHFGNKLGDKLRSFFNNLQNARTKLEKINFANLSADIVEMITEYQDIKRKHFEWSQETEKFTSANKLLERQRYAYPTDWLELDRILTEWSNFKQIFNKKSSQLEN